VSLSIQPDRRHRASTPNHEDQPERGFRLITIVRILAIVTAVVGVGGLVAAFCLNEWRTAVVGGALLVVAVMAAAVCVIDALLADRGEFYRRGKLDGWMEGWRGQEPSADDPLLKD